MDFDSELNFEMMMYGHPLDDYLPDDCNDEERKETISSQIKKGSKTVEPQERSDKD